MINNTLVKVTTPSLLGATALGAFALKKGEDKKDTFRTAVKRTTQGSIASFAFLKASDDYRKNNSILKSFATLGIAAASIYAIEVLDKKMCEKQEKNIENKEEENEK